MEERGTPMVKKSMEHFFKTREEASVAAAEAIAERVRSEFAPEELIISIVSPVLGVHTGPRAVALCGYTEE